MPDGSNLISLPAFRREASFSPATISKESRTAELVWTTGAEVRRYSYWRDEEYIEVLPVTEDAIDLTRLNNGGPLLDSHLRYYIDNVIGVVERAWIDGKEGRAVVRFDTGARGEEAWRKVQDGILRQVSVGYSIDEMERQEKKGETPRYVATRWTPFEVSLVAVGADAGAGVRSQSGADEGEGPKFPCRFTTRDMTADPTRSESMTTQAAAAAQTSAETTSAAQTPAITDDQRAAIAAAERARIEDIRHTQRAFGLDEATVMRAINDGTSASDFMAAQVRTRSSSSATALNAPDGPRPHQTIQVRGDERAVLRERMTDAMAFRFAPDLFKKPTDGAREFIGMRTQFLMIEYLRQTNDLPTILTEDAIIERSMHSTSDFPLILGNTANKIMSEQYALAEPIYRMLARRSDFVDFKSRQVLRLGDMPIPLPLNEGGEAESGSISENAETVQLREWGRTFNVTRRMLINDDLGAFADVARQWGRVVPAWEDWQFFQLLAQNSGSGPTVEGGIMFQTAAPRANQASAGTTIDITNVGLARAAMMKQVNKAQTGRSSEQQLMLSIVPNILLTGPDRITLAEQFCSTNIMPTQNNQVNPFAGKLRPMSSAWITANRWYLFSDTVPNFQWGYRQGSNGPEIRTREGWNPRGVEFYLGHDWSVDPIDYRGGYFNPGA